MLLSRLMDGQGHRALPEPESLMKLAESTVKSIRQNPQIKEPPCSLQNPPGGPRGGGQPCFGTPIPAPSQTGGTAHPAGRYQQGEARVGQGKYKNK